MTVLEFLMSYQDIINEIDEINDRIRELCYPARGNRIVQGEHSGISNQPEEIVIMREKLEKKLAILEVNAGRQKKRIESLLKHLKPRQSKILRRKYIEGLNSLELAAWMHVTQKSALAALRFATEEAEKEYNKLYPQKEEAPE